VAASGAGGVDAVYADENVWLSQKMLGLLYDVETQTVNYHLKKDLRGQRVGGGFNYQKFSDNCRRWERRLA